MIFKIYKYVLLNEFSNNNTYSDKFLLKQPANYIT